MKMMMMMRLAAALLSSLHSLGVLLLCFPLALLFISSSSSNTSFSRFAALAQTPPNTTGATIDPVDGAYIHFPSLLLSLPSSLPSLLFFPFNFSTPAHTHLFSCCTTYIYVLYFEFPMSLNKRDFSSNRAACEI